MANSPRPLACSIMFGASVAACGDLPAGVDRTVPHQPVRVASIAAVGRSAEFVCFTSMRTSGGPNRYAYGAIVLRFPASARASDAAVEHVRLRWQTASGEVMRAAHCRIPRTPQAKDILERRLLVDDRRRPMRTVLRPRYDTTTGCVQDGYCPIDGIIVYGPGGGFSGGGAGGGGGCGWNASAGDCYYDPYGGGGWDPSPDGTERPECQRDASGSCVTRPLDPVNEWPRLLDRIERLKEEPDYCKGAKDALRHLASFGPEAQRIRFWDGYDVQASGDQRIGENLADAAGRYIEYDSYWIWNDSSLLVHEGIHYWLNQNADNTGVVSRPDGMSNEDWVRSVDQNCV